MSRSSSCSCALYIKTDIRTDRERQTIIITIFISLPHTKIRKVFPFSFWHLLLVLQFWCKIVRGVIYGWWRTCCCYCCCCCRPRRLCHLATSEPVYVCVSKCMSCWKPMFFGYSGICGWNGRKFLATTRQINLFITLPFLKIICNRIRNVANNRHQKSTRYMQ